MTSPPYHSPSSTSPEPQTPLHETPNPSPPQSPPHAPISSPDSQTPNITEQPTAAVRSPSTSPQTASVVTLSASPKAVSVRSPSTSPKVDASPNLHTPSLISLLKIENGNTAQPPILQVPSIPPEPQPNPSPRLPEKRGDPTSSPLRHDGQWIPPLLPLPVPPQNTPEKPATPTAESAAAAAAVSVSAVAIASRFSRDELGVVGKVADGGVRVANESFSRVDLPTRRPRVKVFDFVVVGVRVSAAVLCLIALSVMAADKTEGWAGDSFDRYIEFRYLIGINAISFAYSSFQIFLDVYHLVTNKNLIGFPVRYCVDLSMDQILAYLLMSASSAAASRNDVWVSRFGSDKFTKMADGSIAVSFLAFIALALSSVISARNLFRWKS